LYPSADLDANTTYGYAPLTVEYACESRGGDQPLHYRVDLGNGESETGNQHPIATYHEPGTYTAICRVTDIDGDEATDSLTVTVIEQPEEPVHDLALYQPSIPSSARTGEAVMLSSSVENQGNRHESSTIRFFVDGAELPGCSGSFADLAPGAVDGEGYTCPWTATEGEHTIRIRVDPVAGETDLSDNAFEQTIQVSCEDCQPYAFVNATPREGYAPLEVDFTCYAKYGNEPYAYSWDFGDGSMSDSPNPTHTYQEPGSYHAVCTVTDVDGDHASNGLYIGAWWANHAPTADFMWTPPQPMAGEAVGFNTLSTDPDYNIVSYEWDLDNDGVFEAYGMSEDHVFLAPGSYIITHRVTDAYGLSDTVSKTVVVREQPHTPVSALIIADPLSGPASLDVSFKGRGTGDGRLTYTWDFNDGSGQYTVQNLHHVFRKEGAYLVTLTVTDEDGDTAQDTETITVRSDGRDDLPRQKMVWTRFRLLNDEELRPGDTALVLVSLTNNGHQLLEDARITLLSYGMDAWDRIGPFSLAPGETFSRIMYLDIPSWARPGAYDLRAVASSEGGMKRVKHRMFFINGDMTDDAARLSVLGSGHAR
ncbi:MAG: PKD domain-containing protein, partial [DPANN group archaeon]|nr:PKD domain-containing protein [DPANN group archaeon]